MWKKKKKKHIKIHTLYTNINWCIINGKTDDAPKSANTPNPKPHPTLATTNPPAHNNFWFCYHRQANSQRPKTECSPRQGWQTPPPPPGAPPTSLVKEHIFIPIRIHIYTFTSPYYRQHIYLAINTHYAISKHFINHIPDNTYTKHTSINIQ